MAVRFAERGGRVVAWDIDRAGLDGTVAAIRAAGGPEPFADTCNVMDKDSVRTAAERAKSEVGDVEILVNNAGVVSGRPFLECTDEQIERTIGVNTMALFWTSKCFVPSMIERNSGHVVTIASAAGLVGVARLTDYCASKWAAVGFDESLRVEFKRFSPGVKTTVVCPFYIDTGMFDGVKTRFPLLLPILDEKKTVERIVRAVEKDKPRLIMPWMVRLVPLMKFFPPAVHDALNNLLGVNHSMDDFVGRKRS
jgi:all-trans-retinol dehydrogenase (NAD+)